MFGKQMEAARTDRHGQSFLQEGMTINGEIQAEGELRVDGRVEGRIQISERLTVGSTGEITAEIVANEVVIEGSVTGKIRASRRLELRKGAKMIGDIVAPVLVIEEGAQFQGHSSMDAGTGRDYVLQDGVAEPVDGRADPSAESYTAYR
jgi:cytoskeletal protein CcmA (bactofilin family)